MKLTKLSPPPELNYKNEKKKKNNNNNNIYFNYLISIWMKGYLAEYTF